MTKPWRLECCICGEVSVETYEGFNFCDFCWEWFRLLMKDAGWNASPEFLIKKMKEKMKR